MKASITVYNETDENPELVGVYRLAIFSPEATDKTIELEVDQYPDGLKLSLQLEPEEARLFGEMLIKFAEI